VDEERGAAEAEMKTAQPNAEPRRCLIRAIAWCERVNLKKQASGLTGILERTVAKFFFLKFQPGYLIEVAQLLELTGFQEQ
jgi:hypothetical protein